MTMHEIAFILYCYKYKNFNYLNNLEHILCIELCMADTYDMIVLYTIYYILSYTITVAYKSSRSSSSSTTTTNTNNNTNIYTKVGGLDSR
jgi:hypothetical protein